MLSEKPIHIGPQGQSGKAIRGFPGHLPGSGRQLPEIDIEIRLIRQVYYDKLNSSLPKCMTVCIESCGTGDMSSSTVLLYV